MGSLTDQGENLACILLGLVSDPTSRSYAASVTSKPVQVALLTVAPNDAGAGGQEVVGGSYARQTLTPSTGTNPSVFTPSSTTAGSASNALPVTFTGMPAVTITAFFLTYLSPEYGSPSFAYGNFATPITVPANGVVVFPAGSIVFTID